MQTLMAMSPFTSARQVETHKRVDSLGRGVDDVDQTLVSTHFEVLTAVLVLVRRADDAYTFFSSAAAPVPTVAPRA